MVLLGQLFLLALVWELCVCSVYMCLQEKKQSRNVKGHAEGGVSGHRQLLPQCEKPETCSAA